MGTPKLCQNLSHTAERFLGSHAAVFQTYRYSAILQKCNRKTFFRVYCTRHWTWCIVTTSLQVTSVSKTKCKHNSRKISRITSCPTRWDVTRITDYAFRTIQWKHLQKLQLRNCHGNAATNRIAVRKWVTTNSWSVIIIFFLTSWSSQFTNCQNHVGSPKFSSCSPLRSRTESKTYGRYKMIFEKETVTFT